MAQNMVYLVNVPYALEKNVYSAVVGALSSGSQVKRVVLLRSISFLQFFLVLAIAEKR